MKLHISRTTISCLEILFSCFLDHIDPFPKIILSGLTAAHGESCSMKMSKVPLWKTCSEMMPGTTLAASTTHTHRAARTPGGAEDLLLQLELAPWGSGQWQWHWEGSVPWHSCSLSPGLQHILHLAAVSVEAKTFWAVCCAQKRRLPAWWTFSTSEKTMRSQKSTYIVFQVVFPLRQGLWMFQVP